MIKKILIPAYLLLSLQYYDAAVRNTGGEYSVNLGAFYFASWHMYFFLTVLVYIFETRVLFYKAIFLLFNFAIFINLYQNLISFNESYDVFQLNVNNPLIDVIKWTVLIVSLFILLLWEGLKLMRK